MARLVLSLIGSLLVNKPDNSSKRMHLAKPPGLFAATGFAAERIFIAR